MRRALKVLHEKYQVPNVVISSIPLRRWLLEALPPRNRPVSGTLDGDTDYLLCIASSATDTTKGPQPSVVHTRSVTCIPGYFSGVGDLFSALVLAHFRASQGAAPESHLAHAASQALAKTHAILQLTDQHAATLPEEERQPTDEELDKKEPERRVRRMKGRELRLIQGQDVIRSSVIPDAKMGIWEGFWEE